MRRPPRVNRLPPPFPTRRASDLDLTFALTSGGGEIVVTGSRVRVTQLEVGPGTSFSTEVLESAPSFNRDVRDIIRLDPRVSLDRDDAGGGQEDRKSTRLNSSH